MVAPAILIGGIAALCAGCLPAGAALIVVAFVYAVVRFYVVRRNDPEEQRLRAMQQGAF